LSDEFEVTGEGQESPPPAETEQAPPVQEQPQEAPPEFIPYRRADGTEAQLPAAEAQRIVEALGYDNAAVLINKLSLADESDQVLREAKEYYRRATRHQTPRTDAEYQGIEARRQQAPPQYRPPQQPQVEEDPVAIIRNIHEQQRELREQFQEFLQAQQQQRQAEQIRQAQDLERQSVTEYNSFVADLKSRGVPDWKIPDKERLEEDAADLGLGYSRKSLGEIYRLAHKIQNPEFYTRAEVNKIMERQREPKAKVPVPASRPPATPPPKTGGLDGVTPTDLMAMLRDSARPAG